MSTANYPELKVFVIGPRWGLPSMSPFGCKLATWFRIAGLPHQLCYESDPRKGPKKKSPWIVEGAEVMGDSELIIRHLTATRGFDPDARLDASSRTTGLLLRRTFEEHFHQIVEYALFFLDDGWRQMSQHFDEVLQVPLRIVKPLIRSGSKKEGWTRGLARHTPDEIAALCDQDLEAAEAVLGDKPYFLGDAPTTTDSTMFGFLSHTLYSPVAYFAQEQLKARPKLVAYCDRMRERYWRDIPESGTLWRPTTAHSAALSA